MAHSAEFRIFFFSTARRRTTGCPFLTQQCPERLARRVLPRAPAPPALIYYHSLSLHSSQFWEPSVSFTSPPLLVRILLYQVSLEVFFRSLERPHFPKETWPTRSSGVKWAPLEAGYSPCSNCFLVKPKHAALLQTTQVVVSLYLLTSALMSHVTQFVGFWTSFKMF